MRCFFLVAVGVVLLGNGIASAITLSASGSAPATDILEQQPVLEGYYGFQWTGNGNDQHTAQYQSFRHVASNYAVDKITVLFNPGLNAAAFNAGVNMNLRLLTWTAGNSGGQPATGSPGTPFLEETGALPTGWVNNTPRYLTFDITNQNLLINQQYGFAVDFTTAVAPGSGFGASLVASLGGNGSDASYPIGGKRFYTEKYSGNGGNPDFDASDDLVFFIQAPVPEPSSFVLAGLGLVGLIGYVRKQRNRS